MTKILLYARSTLLAMFCIVVAVAIGTACGAGLTNFGALFGYIPSWIGTILALYAGPILAMVAGIFLLGDSTVRAQFFAGAPGGHPQPIARLSEDWALICTMMGFFGFFSAVISAFTLC